MSTKNGSQPQETPEVHWLKAESYKLEWARRAQYVAALIKGGSVVCDIGCGQQSLRKYLPSNTIYLPADLKQWTEDTELCDLNAGQFPEKSLARCDTCVMLGVITYIIRPQSVFDKVARHAEHLIVTYNVTDFSDFAHPLWVNRYNLEEMTAMIWAAGYKTIDVSRFENTAILNCS